MTGMGYLGIFALAEQRLVIRSILLLAYRQYEKCPTSAYSHTLLDFELYDMEHMVIVGFWAGRKVTFRLEGRWDGKFWEGRHKA